MLAKLLNKKKNEKEESEEIEEKQKKAKKNKFKKRSGKVPLVKKGDEEQFQGDRGFTYPFGYQDEDAYLFVGHKRVISVFDVLIQYGTNNPATIGWLLNLIP